MSRNVLRRSAFCLTLLLLFTTFFSGFTAFVQPNVAHAASDFQAGTGTEGDPYQIATAEQLNSVRNYLSEGLYFKLIADIDLSGYQEGFGWVPIGVNNTNFFQGNMDGNGYKITNLKVYKPSYYVGLFGHIGNKATLSNMRLENIALTGGTMYSGGLVGANKGTITNSSASGSVSGKDDIGGLVGVNTGTITNSSAAVSVTSTTYNVGGLVGTNEGTINTSYATGSANGGSAVSSLGGLVGLNKGTIGNSYAAASVSGGSSGGGLVGGNYGSISNSYAIGIVKTSIGKGGLVGDKYSTSNISNSFYNKNTTGQSDTGKGVGKTTAEMQTQSTYTGWDFTTTWGIHASRNNQYPYLQAIQKFVAYDGNGATSGSVPTDNVSYSPGSKVSVSHNTGNLTKPGYTFAEWNTQADGQGTGYAVNSTFAIGTDHVTLYAKWTAVIGATYTVTFDSQGGSLVSSLTGVTSGATISAPTAPTKAGYTFGGWYKEAGTTTAWNFSTDTVTADTTLYAKWTAIPTYTVTYNSNGAASGSVPSDSNRYEQGAIVTVQSNTGNLTKPGYTFAGWNTQADGQGTSYASNATFAMGTSNVTLYAQWTEIPTYTVTYNSNGAISGSVPSDGNRYEQGSTVTVQGNTGDLTKPGYTFTEWNTQADGQGTSYAANATFTIGTSNVMLYAQWTAIPTYTVTFDSQGGSLVSDLMGVTSGATISAPTAPTKAGYTFDGWYKEAGTTTAWNFSTDTVTADTTLYAKWTAIPTYTVTYNSNGAASGSVPSDGNRYEQGATVTVLGNTGNLAKPGYTFEGWNTQADGQGTSYASNATFAMGTSNVTLYAKWTAIPTYTVTYNSNGAISGSVPSDSNRYEQGTTVTVLGNTGNLAKPGYTFEGWNTEADGQGTIYASNATFAIGTSNVTLYAKWTAIPTYTVTFDSQGGSLVSNLTGVTSGATISAPTAPTKSGYTFDGWYKEAGATTAWNFSTDTVTADMTLYAKWTAIPTYTVTYNSNGAASGSVPSDSNRYEQGTTVTVQGNTGNLTKPGYTFEGWNTQADGEGTNYAANATFAIGAANVTLYAKWTAIPTYTVTFDSQGGSLVSSLTGVTSGATISAPTAPTKAGYTFGGWYKEAVATTAWNFSTDTVTADTTLYAKWTAIPTYTVTYNSNGAASGSVPSDGNAYEQGSTVTVQGNTGNLTKLGYTFEGWNTQADGEGTNYAANATFAIGAANVTLYAKWTAIPTYTVTFDSQGGSLVSSLTGVTSGATISAPTAPTKAGYTFDGWYKEAGTTTAWNFSTDTVTVDTTLYAKWTAIPTYTVTYNSNGATSGSVPSDGNAYEQGATVTVQGNTGNLTKLGYTFEGWNTQADGEGTNYAPNATFAIGAANVTLYAKWTEIPTYTVTFDSQGGSLVSNLTDVTSGATISAPTAPTKAGYTFGGWYKEARATTAWNFSTDTVTADTTLYAKWIAIPTYTVTFDSQGGSLVSNLTDVTSGATISAPTAPTKAGYTFGGWYKEAGATTAWNFSTDTVTADTTLYAKWTAIPTYTVTYNSNGATSGSVPNDGNAYEQGATVTVQGNTGNLTKPGYTFTGWNTQADGQGTNYAANATFTIGSSNVTLYAKWTAIPTYTVTYNSNGATSGSVPNDGNAYEQGATVTVQGNTGNLTKPGYTFTGWNTQADGEGTNYAANATFTIGLSNVTLYAQWTAIPTYTVTYNSNGATSGSVPSDGNAYEQGATVTVLGNTGNLTKPGYTFEGWNTQADGQGTSYAANATFAIGTSNVTLYAKWTEVIPETYTVTFDSQGGSLVSSLTGVTSGATISAPTAPTKAGYTFHGWYKEAGATMEWNFSTDTVTADRTLYAKWTAIPTYTVTYNSNGATSGSVPSDNNRYEQGATVTVQGNTGNLTKPGYTFEGWNTQADGQGTSYAANATFAIGTSNVTLYAKWTEVIPETYTVTFDSQGGSLVSDLTGVISGATISAPTAPTKAGYTFGGWYKEAGTTTEWNFSTDTVTADTTLYAKWTEVIPETYTVTFDSQGGSLVSDLTGVISGATISAPTAPTRSGYTFGGWYKEAGATTVWNFSADVVTSNTTLYAKWTAINAGGGGGGSTPPPDNSKVISDNGKLTLPAGKAGEVSLENEIMLSIPANATDKELELTIYKVLDTQGLVTEKDVLASAVYEVLKNFPENFRKPVTLTFTFDPASLKSGQRPSVFYYDEVKKEWVEIGGKVNGNKITVTVDHFTKFAVFGVGQQTDTKETTHFSDIAGHWAEANIKQAVSAAIVSGYPDGSFKPNRTVTRAEFAVMLMNALKPQGDGAELKFTDKGKIASWAQKAVAYASEARIISGYADGTFRPDAEITRSEMAVMVARALDQSATEATDFADDKDIPTWAKGAAGGLKKLGIMEGKGANQFAPGDKTTRAEAVTVLLKMLAYKNK